MLSHQLLFCDHFVQEVDCGQVSSTGRQPIVVNEGGGRHKPEKIRHNFLGVTNRAQPWFLFPALVSLSPR